MSTPSGSNPTPAAGASPTVGITPDPLPVMVKIAFTLKTPDGLREISFGLEKDGGGAKVNWTIAFTLFERANTSSDFGDPIVRLSVFVAATLHSKAEAAVRNGLTPVQTAHATGPAADAAKAAHAGTITLPVADNAIQKTLTLK